MKITMQASDLAEMVNVCSMAISSKPMKPIYECVYLEAHSEEGLPCLTVMGKDVGVAIRKVTDRAVVEDDGQALIPAKSLLNFLKLMEGEIKLTVDEKGVATLKGKGKKVSINCLDGAEYEPGFMQIDDVAKECTMDGLDYGTLVSSVSHCIAPDEGRIALTGINFSFDGTKANGGVEAVGMSGYRIAAAKKNVETNDVFSALVPAVSAKLVQKVIGSRENVSFRFGKGVMIAEAYDVAIEVSLLAAEFMDYNKLLKHNGTLKIKANTKALLNAVSLAMISASEGKKGLIVFTVKDDETLEVSAMSDINSAVTDIPVMVQGQLTKNDGTSDGNEIAFNGKFVEDCLKVQTGYGEEVVLEFKSSVTPMEMKPADRDDYFQVILPVRRIV